MWRTSLLSANRAETYAGSETAGRVPLVTKASTPLAFIYALQLGTFVPSRDTIALNAWMGARTHPRIRVYNLMYKKEGRTLGPPFLLVPVEMISRSGTTVPDRDIIAILLGM